MKSLTACESKSATRVANSTTRLGRKRSMAMTLKPLACKNLARRPAPENNTSTAGRVHSLRLAGKGGTSTESGWLASCGTGSANDPLKGGAPDLQSRCSRSECPSCPHLAQACACLH
eukprot:4076031-Amphidinium_carterae.1